MRTRGTEPFRIFAEERNRLLGLNDLVITKMMGDLAEDVAQITGNAPPGKQRPLPTSDELREYKDKQTRFADYAALARELLYCRVADSYERYLGAVLRQVLTLDPAMQRKTFASTESPASLQVEKVIGTFFRGPIEKAVQKIAAKYDIVLFSATDAPEIIRMLETRHVFTHNHGLLDHRALEKLGLPESQIGLRLSLEPTEIGKALNVVLKAAEDFDGRMLSRFALPAVTVPALRTKA